MSLHSSVLWSLAILLACSAAEVAPAAQTAPIGVAKIDITPDCPVRLYGYDEYTFESQDVAGRLKAAALAIGGDEGDGSAVILTVDNGAVPAEMRAEVLRRVQARATLKPERFMLCSAHIHSGPNLQEMDSTSGVQHEHLVQYRKELLDRMERVVLQALASRRPGRLAWTQGSVGFAGNRRTLENGKWVRFGKYDKGPVDRSLPLLRVTDADGKLLAVLINYACHNTTLRGNNKQIHGDWAGCAQEFIEAGHPGAIAMIAIGCGADSDPYPNGSVELCRQHGHAVADEVQRLLAGPLKPVEPKVTARATVLTLPYGASPDIDRLKALAKDSYIAGDVLNRLGPERKRPAAEKYPLAAWTFGDDLAMVFLGDEVVVDYALRMKREFDAGRLWINAYTNDVSFYIESKRLLKEGGYEVNNSLSTAVTYGWPERLRPAMEDRIVETLRTLLPKGFLSPAK
ncbi:MAG: neutral/alkaline non-lysosomal ceramidase N-terminal domain-containing protein [Thermoguttaceae bacterium]|jgi:hypothetical protein